MNKKQNKNEQSRTGTKQINSLWTCFVCFVVMPYTHSNARALTLSSIPLVLHNLQQKSHLAKKFVKNELMY